MKWWEISWFCYVFMAPSSVFLTFSWEISHKIIILHFCNIWTDHLLILRSDDIIRMLEQMADYLVKRPFCYIFMAPSSIFLTFSWEISHNIIILRFCNIVEGQAKCMDAQRLRDNSCKSFRLEMVSYNNSSKRYWVAKLLIIWFWQLK